MHGVDGLSTQINSWFELGRESSRASWIPAFAGMSGIDSGVMSFFVYILASRRNGTLYIGMTDDLARRIWQHRVEAVPGFTKKYGVKTFVWYEQYETRESAFTRERQLKKWNRAWKLQLIEGLNPTWRDLYDDLLK